MTRKYAIWDFIKNWVIYEVIFDGERTGIGTAVGGIFDGARDFFTKEQTRLRF